MRSEIEALTSRIARLERQNRKLKTVSLGIVLGLAAFLLVGAAKTPRTVEAEKIVLRDSHGRARITIGTPALSGNALNTNPDDPVIWLSDEKGIDRAILATDGLRFVNSKARGTVSLSSDPSGVPALKFYGTDGTVSWSAP